MPPWCEHAPDFPMEEERHPSIQTVSGKTIAILKNIKKKVSIAMVIGDRNTSILV